MNTLKWNQIPETVTNYLQYDSWGDTWAKKTYSFLEKHNLTSWNNRKEKIQLQIRIIALIRIWREFCDIAYNETEYFGDESDLEIASIYKISTFELLLISAEYMHDYLNHIGIENFYDYTEEQFYADVMIEMVYREKKKIFHVLVEELGNKWEVLHFFSDDYDTYRDYLNWKKERKEIEEEIEYGADPEDFLYDEDEEYYNEYEVNKHENFLRIVNNMHASNWILNGFNT